MALLFSKMWRTGIVTEDLGPGGPETLRVARALEGRTRLLLGRSRGKCSRATACY